MFVICPECWRGMSKSPAVCKHCGARVDLYSRAYERRLLAILPRADPETRALICWMFGSRRKRSGLRPLLKLLCDPDITVRIAALRGVGEIGDPSAIDAVKELTKADNLLVQTVARNVLKILTSAESRVQ
jgi:HEAT repeat protein